MVKKLVFEWFKKLTDHAPLEELKEMLYLEDLTMKFPEATLENEKDFENWYKDVSQTFFDQVHELKMLDMVLNADTAEVKLIVNWQARTWDPPAGYSQWTGFYAHQSWKIVKDGSKLKIKEYIVESLEDMEGPLKI